MQASSDFHPREAGTESRHGDKAVAPRGVLLVLTARQHDALTRLLRLQVAALDEAENDLPSEPVVFTQADMAALLPLLDADAGGGGGSIPAAVADGPEGFR